MPLAQGGGSIKVAFYPLRDSTLRLLGRFIRMQTCEIMKRGKKGKKWLGKRSLFLSNSYKIEYLMLLIHFP